MRYKISPTELITASKSIINQVNWSEMVLDVVERKRPALYRNAFEKILRLHIEKLLRHENIDKNRLSRHKESRIDKDACEDQRLLSTVKSTDEISSGLTLTSSSTDKRFPDLKEQDNGNFVIGKNSEHKDSADENKKNNTDKNDTDENDTGVDNSEENYSEENDIDKDDNNTRYRTSDEDKDWKDDQISL